uniref:Secreted protein n=1 Tax=Ascaris lumbricoides TaxID=6252 RepID=A0A0M3I2T9_ASCLU
LLPLDAFPFAFFFYLSNHIQYSLFVCTINIAIRCSTCNNFCTIAVSAIIAALKHLHANCLQPRPLILFSVLLPLSLNIVIFPSERHSSATSYLPE